MKTKPLQTLVALVAVAALTIFILPQPQAAESGSSQSYEYATLRFRGKDKTHLIQPDGKVEFLRRLLENAPRINEVEEREYLMNLALNAAAKEGYELVTMHPETYILRRAVK
jgi:hypothetical protein